jgi:hypothetical protein
MSLMGLFRRIDRKNWFVCSTCMQRTNHDTVASVFYSVGPRELVLGRPMARCPRCATTNTRSFEEMKNDGAEAALWGLERIVKNYPRRHFEVKPADIKG